MSPKVFYRIASVLLVLFALGHQLGFQHADPQWHVDSVVGAMQSVHFQVQGLTRSYWDFFAGFGYFVTVFLIFAAVLAWQLGGLRNDALAVVRWTFAASFVVIAFLSWRYFFIIPLVFSAVIALCLFVAVLVVQRPNVDLHVTE